MSTDPKTRKHLAIFGAKRKGEDFEDFKDRVINTLRKDGRIDEDGNIDLSPMGGKASRPHKKKPCASEIEPEN